MNSRIAVALVGLAAAVALAAPAAAQHWSPGRWNWEGGRDGDARPYDLSGPGVGLLLPELRDTRRGRAFVLRNFDRGHDGFITPGEAHEANRAFLDAVGPDRARFRWEIVDRGPMAGPPPARPRHWDRAGMRGYGFRDTGEGARLTLQDNVLFRTDSAALLPGATAKLETLAAYLQDNPGVRVAIDGYTDSRGSTAHNQVLSEQRATSVRVAFGQLGVTTARFRVRGHGEADPVAPNTSPEGMARNRRVEITLLGQRASAFR